MPERIILLENADDTEKLARTIGKNLRGGECFELSSDLGGGKTTFTRGLVIGIGSPDHVSSPSFTIKNQYNSRNLTCYHFDFYRLQDPGLLKEELAESLSDINGVVVVEWAESVDEVLPSSRITINFDKTTDSSEHRKVTMKFPIEYSYIANGVI